MSTAVRTQAHASGTLFIRPATRKARINALLRLEALEPVAKQAGASRQLLRALRNQFTTKTECAELRAAVATIVSAPVLAGSPTP
jgi:hypothetical protein